MKPWQILIAVAVPGAMAVCFIGEHRSQSAEIAELRADLTAVSKAQAEDRRATSRLPGLSPLPARPSILSAAAPVAAATAQEDEPAAQADSLSKADRPSPIEPGEVQQRLESRFSQERADAAFAAPATRAARDKLPALLPESSSVRSVDCRASMCRIETAHEDLDHYREFVQKTFIAPDTHLWNGGFFTTVIDDPSGKVVSVAYLARDGEYLPAVE